MSKRFHVGPYQQAFGEAGTYDDLIRAGRQAVDAFGGGDARYEYQRIREQQAGSRLLSSFIESVAAVRATANDGLAAKARSNVRLARWHLKEAYQEIALVDFLREAGYAPDVNGSHVEVIGALHALRDSMSVAELQTEIRSTGKEKNSVPTVGSELDKVINTVTRGEMVSVTGLLAPELRRIHDARFHNRMALADKPLVTDALDAEPELVSVMKDFADMAGYPRDLTMIPSPRLPDEDRVEPVAMPELS